MLAVLVFEALIHESGHAAPALIVWGVIKTVAIGAALGGAAAVVIVVLLRRHWLPDHLHNPATLALMVGAFTLSNQLQEESGLLTVILMGIVIANQRQVAIRHLVEFKENLRTLLLSFLFVMLAARLELGALRGVGWGSVAFLLALMIIARPAAVFLSSWRSTLQFREKIFLSFMAPRGIVAAAVTSIFALRLEDRFPQANVMVPAMFVVIIVTVAVYGLLSKGLAKWLAIAQPNPQGVLFIGAHRLARRIAEALKNEGVAVRLIDNNRANTAAARMEGLDAYYGDALSDNILDGVSVNDMGKALAVTANDRVNALAILNFADIFGRTEMYQLASESETGPTHDDMGLPLHLRGRSLFSKQATYGKLLERLDHGAAVKVTKLTKEFDYAAFRARHGASAIPMFVLSDDGRVTVIAAEKAPTPTVGQRIVSLISPDPV
jgi:NhaP-type Na+/H+ and K+/H+ antiporter